VLQNSTGTLLVVGTIEASEFVPGVSGTNRAQVTLLTGPFLTSPTFGVNPIGCNAWRWASTLNTSTYIEVPTSDLLAKRNLVTADNVTGMPAEADVKDGVVYGPASELTGTFEQTVTPSVSDIATAVWSATTREITGGTVDTLTNAPASVTPSDIWSHSSRTLTSASGPSAADIRTELDTNSTKLANLDATVSSRLASASYTAPTTPPTATAIADEVRVELATELAHLDADISTRATPADIPASDISAIKAKTDALNTDRLGQCSTVATTGAQLAAALS
jgi:hypothetical protein